MTVAELVKKRLIELGWSNAELARRSGLSGTYIGQIVNDRVPGTPAGRKVHWTEPTLKKLAEALSLPLASLRDAAGLKTTSHPLPKEEELIEAIRELPPEKQEDLILIVKALLQKYRMHSDPTNIESE